MKQSVITSVVDPASQPQEELSALEPIVATNTPGNPPGSEESSPTETALVAVEQANAIDRIPVNCAIEYVQQEEFSQARLDQLFARWDDGQAGFFTTLAVRSEIVYEIHKETAKPGCTGGFSAALRRIKLPASTAYDMIMRHKIRIGEMEDPDAYDSRDDEEERSEDNAEATQSSSSRGSKRGTAGRAKTAVITLSGSIAEAVTEVQTFYHKANPKEAIQFCVLRVWSELKTPLAKHDAELAGSSPEVSKRRLPSLNLDDDFLDDKDSVDTKAIVTAEIPPYLPDANVTGGASGAA